MTIPATPNNNQPAAPQPSANATRRSRPRCSRAPPRPPEPPPPPRPPAAGSSSSSRLSPWRSARRSGCRPHCGCCWAAAPSPWRVRGVHGVHVHVWWPGAVHRRAHTRTNTHVNTPCSNPCAFLTQQMRVHTRSNHTRSMRCRPSGQPHLPTRTASTPTPSVPLSSTIFATPHPTPPQAPPPSRSVTPRRCRSG